MILSEFQVEIYYVRIWFSDLPIYMVIALQAEVRAVIKVVKDGMLHMTHGKVKVMCYTTANVYPDSMQDHFGELVVSLE